MKPPTASFNQRQNESVNLYSIIYDTKQIIRVLITVYQVSDHENVNSCKWRSVLVLLHNSNESCFYLLNFCLIDWKKNDSQCCNKKWLKYILFSLFLYIFPSLICITWKNDAKDDDHVWRPGKASSSGL